jgi:hypothetical protein
MMRFPKRQSFRSGWLIGPIRSQPWNMQPALVIQCGTPFTRGKLVNPLWRAGAGVSDLTRARHGTAEARVADIFRRQGEAWHTRPRLCVAQRPIRSTHLCLIARRNCDRAGSCCPKIDNSVRCPSALHPLAGGFDRTGNEPFR